MLEIAPLRDQFEAAATLMNDALGRGSFTAEKVAALAAEPHGQLVGARAADGNLLGVAHARELPREGAAFYRVFGDDIVHMLEQRRLGSLFASAVVPEARGQGIGSQLARARLTWLRERGCNYAIGISWQSGLPHTSRPVFERLGFRMLSESNTFFSDTQNQQQSTGCMICGASCSCPALLYGREL